MLAYLQGYRRPVLVDGECWLWQGRLNSSGYGPHRKVYQKLLGPVSPHLELDHLCKNRACVNPDHLEPVPKTANMRRVYGDVCPRGHAYRYAGTRGKRRCPVCRNDYRRQRYHMLKAG